MKYIDLYGVAPLSKSKVLYWDKKEKRYREYAREKDSLPPASQRQRKKKR